MVEVFRNLLMEMSIEDSFSKESLTGKAFINGKMEVCMKESSLKEKEMAKVNGFLIMETSLKENTYKT